MSDIEIISPLQELKTKRVPHEKRRSEVFQALDRASAQGLTSYAELIEFVCK